MNTFGKNIKITIFGESHSNSIGVVISGLPSGIKLDEELIKRNLQSRHNFRQISTKRFEKDEYKIVSGYFNDKTTGAPLTFIIDNTDVDSSSYQEGIVRPSHSDYPLFIKHKGANDYRGGGASSGRMTALLVIVGSICEQILKEKGINVYSYISQVKHIKTPFITDEEKLTLLKNLSQDAFMISKPLQQEATNLIKKTSLDGDALPCTLETLVTGVNAGIGEPFFDSFESTLSHLLFSIPGVKGIAFGDEDLPYKYSSEAIDELSIINNEICISSSHQGGINGGVTNGGIIKFRTSFKAPVSIKKEIKSINLLTKENISLSTKGRHDPIIGPRALPVINAVVYYTILDLLIEAKKHETIR